MSDTEPRTAAGRALVEWGREVAIRGNRRASAIETRVGIPTDDRSTNAVLLATWAKRIEAEASAALVDGLEGLWAQRGGGYVSHAARADICALLEGRSNAEASAAPDREALLDRIRDEVRQAVIEGDASDCSSSDCIADAVYEIVRVALPASTPAPLDTAAPDRLREAVAEWFDGHRPSDYTPADHLRFPDVNMPPEDQHLARVFAALPASTSAPLDVERLARAMENLWDNAAMFQVDLGDNPASDLARDLAHAYSEIEP